MHNSVFGGYAGRPGHSEQINCSESVPVNSRPQLTQSKNLYQAPANGKNHGFPLYIPSGAPGNGIPANGFSSRPVKIAVAIFCPSNVAIATPCPAYPTEKYIPSIFPACGMMSNAKSKPR